MSKRRVATALNNLEKVHGLIARRSRVLMGQKLTNEYTITLPLRRRSREKWESKGVVHEVPMVVHEVPIELSKEACAGLSTTNEEPPCPF